MQLDKEGAETAFEGLPTLATTLCIIPIVAALGGDVTDTTGSGFKPNLPKLAVGTFPNFASLLKLLNPEAKGAFLLCAAAVL